MEMRHDRQREGNSEDRQRKRIRYAEEPGERARAEREEASEYEAHERQAAAVDPEVGSDPFFLAANDEPGHVAARHGLDRDEERACEIQNRHDGGELPVPGRAEQPCGGGVEDEVRCVPSEG